MRILQNAIPSEKRTSYSFQITFISLEVLGDYISLVLFETVFFILQAILGQFDLSILNFEDSQKNICEGQKRCKSHLKQEWFTEPQWIYNVSIYATV